MTRQHQQQQHQRRLTAQQRPAFASGVAAVVLALVALLFPVAVDASHFRYGTLTWKPLKTVAAGKRDVRFEFRASYRRNYDWGAYYSGVFPVRWASTENFALPSDIDFYGNEAFFKTGKGYNPTLTTCDALAQSQGSVFRSDGCFECPDGQNGRPSIAGTTAGYYGCMNSAPQVDSTTGKRFFLRFTPLMQSPDANGDIKEVVPCPDPFTCDVRKVIRIEESTNVTTPSECYPNCCLGPNCAGTPCHKAAESNQVPKCTSAPTDYQFTNMLSDKYKNPDYVAGEVPEKPEFKTQADFCREYMANPEMDTRKCAPWDVMYGMYMGDGTSKTIDLEVDEDMDTTDNSLTGNFITGMSTFEHKYPSDMGAPVTAYFTGGDRIYECDTKQTNADESIGLTKEGTCDGRLKLMLNNNVEGRFRLEVQVWLTEKDKNGNYLDFDKMNRPPVITQPPTLPVPMAQQGSTTKFQVAAYDLDQDDLTFRFGNLWEMGGIVRSKGDAYPWSSQNPANPEYEPTGQLKLKNGLQYGRFACTEFSNTLYLKDPADPAATCPSDRKPTQVHGCEATSFTGPIPGIVEWNTWKDTGFGGAPCTASSQACEPIREGLYNFVVMVTDSGNKLNPVKVPVDFLVYLYSAPLYFCNKDCKDNKQRTPTDASGTALPSSNAVGDNVQGSTYAPAYAGTPTFADRDGIYGTSWKGNSYTEVPVGNAIAIQSQACTICGYGAGNRNETTCTPNADDTCGMAGADGSIVPRTGACVSNMPPRFVSDGVVSGLEDGPGLAHYDASIKAALERDADYLKPFDGKPRPFKRAFFGKEFEFYVTALDEDDCVELDIKTTGLPTTGTVQLGAQEYLANYPQFPEGMKVRRKFRWIWNNAGNDPVEEDPRDRYVVLCFYAIDKYLVTYSPYYCIDLVLEKEPPKEVMVLVRFDCKLLLGYQPTVRRFVATDGERQYFSASIFEDYMWHHAMVSIDADGKAILVVDGEVQQLMVDIVTDDLNSPLYGKGRVIGESFEALHYPNECIPISPPPPPPPPATGRRHLMGKYVSDHDLTDEPLSDGYPKTLNASDVVEASSSINGTAVAPLDPPTANNDCCSLTIAIGCPNPLANTISFEGIVDEVAIWNRGLTPEEVRHAMFKMPQFLPARELEAPRGVQLDLAAGRVLWARFQNPCMEGPAPAPVPSPPPPGSGGRRNLKQMYPSTASEVNVKINNATRSYGVSDDSGYDSGGSFANGNLKGLDTDDDTMQFISFRKHTHYLYGGVPWAAPFVAEVGPEKPIPMDGGVSITLKGLGFAKSPFLKCAVKQPDPFGRHSDYTPQYSDSCNTPKGRSGSRDTYSPRPIVDGEEYDSAKFLRDATFGKTSGDVVTAERGAFLYEEIESVHFSPAEIHFAPWEASPAPFPESMRNPKNKVYEPPCPVPQSLITYKNAFGDIVTEGRTSDGRQYPSEFDSRKGIFECQMDGSEVGWKAATPCAWCHEGVRKDWYFTNEEKRSEEGDVRGGRVPPFEQFPVRLTLEATSPNYYDDIFVGYFEAITCDAPSVSFPSDKYTIGAVNDGGILGSIPVAVTFQEYAAVFDGSQVLGTKVAGGKSFSAWVYPTQATTKVATIFALKSGLGVYLDDGVLRAKTSADGTIIGSAATNATALDEWHHVMLVVDDDDHRPTIAFYLDGENTIERHLSVPSDDELSVIGLNFVGQLDEIKAFKNALSYTEYVEHMFGREVADPAVLAEYIRFNNGTKSSIAGNEKASCTGTCTFVPSTAPWEPTSVHSVSVSGVERTGVIKTNKMSGDYPVDIVGFNIPRSKWTKCRWGTASNTRTYVAINNYTSVTVEGTVEEMSLDRPDLPFDGVYGVPPYQLFEIVSDYGTSLIETFELSSYTSDTKIQCPSPKTETKLYDFSVTAKSTVTPIPFEFTEVAAYCDGSSYLNATESVQDLDSSKGYSFGMWVLPLDAKEPGYPTSCHGEDVPKKRRHLASTEKKFTDARRRRLAGHAGHSATTVFAFENANTAGVVGNNEALIMYDGERFFYYDDYILDVSNYGDKQKANEWHYVLVMVNEKGDGVIDVDGVTATRFSTVMRPGKTSIVSACQDFDNSDGSTGSMFSGLLDRVAIFSGSLDDSPTFESTSDIARRIMFGSMSSWLAAESSSLVAFYDFTHAFADASDATKVPGAEGTSTRAIKSVGGVKARESSGPWRPADVLSVYPVTGSLKGGETVTVTGSNMAPSRWLSAYFGGGSGGTSMTESKPYGFTTTTPARSCRTEETTVDVTPHDTQAFGASGSFDYDASVKDLADKVAAYWMMDAPAALVSGTNLTLRDQTGNGNDVLYKSALSTTDRDGFEKSAITIDGSTGLFLPIYEAWTKAGGLAGGVFGGVAYGQGLTVCAWLFIDYPAANSAAHAVEVGGWKMICFTADYGSIQWKGAPWNPYKIYVNHKAATSAETSFYLPIMTELVYDPSAGITGMPPGKLDDVWVYTRALSPCEVEARYFTSEYGVDGSEGGMMTADLPPAQGTLTVSAWVFPYYNEPTNGKTFGAQTIVGNAETFSLGLEEDRLVMSVLVGCKVMEGFQSTSTPMATRARRELLFGLPNMTKSQFQDGRMPRSICSQARQAVSWKARVMSGRWSHVAVSYTGSDFFFYVDGVLMDRHYYETNVPIATTIRDDSSRPSTTKPVTGTLLAQESLTNLDHPALHLPLDVRRFNGVIYNLEISDPLYKQAFVVKGMAQCPPKDRTLYGLGVASFDLNAGIGDTAVGFGSTSTMQTIAGVAPLYVNASYDDITSRQSTTITGPEKSGRNSSADGIYTITSHTSCQKKRLIGGDVYEVTMTNASGTYDATVKDTNDGNYHVSYAAGSQLHCGAYTTNVKLAGSDLTSFPTVITPAETNRNMSYVVGDIEAGCYSAKSTFIIQAEDSAGCYQSDGPGGAAKDTFKVTVSGPHEFEADVFYIGGGQYEVSWVPEEAGKYFIYIELTSGSNPGPIRTSHFCVDVCTGNSVEFDGTNYVRVAEATPGVSPLDASFGSGITMEAFLLFPQNEAALTKNKTNAYVFYKGSVAEADGGKFEKGYSLYFNSDFTTITASVYTSLGVVRSITGDFEVRKNGWMHVVASYDGKMMKILADGTEKAAKVFNSFGARAPHADEYDHPLLIGYGMVGLIDEAKIWSVGRLTTPELADYDNTCPPLPFVGHVAAYFAFNEKINSTETFGYGKGCEPTSQLSLTGGCLKGVVGGTNDTVAKISVRNAPTTGVQKPGGPYSNPHITHLVTKKAPSTRRHAISDHGIVSGTVDTVIAGGEHVQYTIDTRDRCNYFYLAAQVDAYRSNLAKFDYIWFTEDPPVPMYPLTKVDSAGIEILSPNTGTCYGGTGAPPYVRGNVYSSIMKPQVTGLHQLDFVTVEAVKFTTTPYMVEVVASVPVIANVYYLDSTHAGVEAAVFVQLIDKFNNVVKAPQTFDVEISLVGEPYPEAVPAKVTYHADLAMYQVAFTPSAAPLEGTYTFLLTSSSWPEELGYNVFPTMTSPAPAQPTPTPTFTPAPSPFRPVAVEGSSLPYADAAAFKMGQSSVLYDGDLFSIAGALRSKEYTNDVMKLTNLHVPSSQGTFSFTKTIDLTVTSSVTDDVTVELTVDTESMVTAGHVMPTCYDIAFKAANTGALLKHYVDPYPGCNTNGTLIYVRLPASSLATLGKTKLHMFFGNPSVTADLGDPYATFAFYEGFEKDETDYYSGGSYVGPFDLVEPCSLKKLSVPSERQCRPSKLFSKAGGGAMHCESNTKAVLLSELGKTLSSFKMTAWMYDSNAGNAAEFISPDYATCDAVPNSENLLPEGGPLLARSTAVGTYTLSHKLKYAVSSPWESAVSERFADWKLLTVESDGSAMTVKVNDQLVKSAPVGTSADRVLISHGYGVDGDAHTNITESHVYWDEVKLIASSPSVVVGEIPSDDEAVSFSDVSARAWSIVSTTGTKPPARVGHTSVVYGDATYVFGGERSSYAYNDMWKLNMTSSSWSYVPPAQGSKVPKGRYGHAAVVSNGAIIVYGGRGGKAGADLYGDMWSFDIATSTWTELSAPPMASRFGHGMTLVGDTIYAFGGWTSAGFSGDFFSCSLTGGSCTDLTYGCHFAPDLPTATDVGLTPRYEVTMANNGKFIVVTGGVSSEMTGHQEAFKFYIDGCSWQKMKLSTTVTATALQGSSGVLSDGSAVYAFAGDSASHNFADVFLLGV